MQRVGSGLLFLAKNNVFSRFYVDVADEMRFSCAEKLFVYRNKIIFLPHEIACQSG